MTSKAHTTAAREHKAEEAEEKKSAAEPKIDLEGFRLEHGSVEELVQYIKDWVNWRMGAK